MTLSDAVEVIEKGPVAYHLSAIRKSTRKAMSVLSKDEHIQLWALLARIRRKLIQEPVTIVGCAAHLS
jgi:hypothetical protein